MACERDSAGPEVDPLAASVSSVQVVELPAEPFWWSGNTVTVRFQAFDLAGKPLPGVGMQIRTTAGNGSVAASRVTAGSLGKVAVQWTFGAIGQNAIEASVPGSAHTRQVSLTVRAKTNDRVRLSADSVTLAGPTCSTELSVSGLTSQANFLGFSMDRPDILGWTTVNTHTGTVGWMYRGIIGRAAESARVIAADGFGGADTVHVRVLGNLPTAAFAQDTVRVAVGASADVGVALSSACGAPMSAFASPNVVGDTAQVGTRSLDTSVVQVVSQSVTVKRITGAKAGTAKIVTKYWGAQDTAVVIVQ